MLELLTPFFIPEGPLFAENVAVVLIVLVGALIAAVLDLEKGNLADVALEFLVGAAPLFIQEEFLLEEISPAVLRVLEDDLKGAVFGGENGDALPMVALGRPAFIFIQEGPPCGGSVPVELTVPFFADDLNGGEEVLDGEKGDVLPMGSGVVPAFIQGDGALQDVAIVELAFVWGDVNGGFDDEAIFQLDGEGGPQLDGDVRFGSSVSAGKGEESVVYSLLAVSSSAVLVVAPLRRGAASLEAAKA